MTHKFAILLSTNHQESMIGFLIIASVIIILKLVRYLIKRK